MQIRIRELRKEKNITMKQLGNALGFSEVTIHHYETGDRKPTPETLLKIANYFNVSVNYLLGEEDDPSQPAQPIPAAHENGASIDPIRLQAMEIFDAIPEDRKDAALDYLRFLAAQKKD